MLLNENNQINQLPMIVFKFSKLLHSIISMIFFSNSIEKIR